VLSGALSEDMEGVVSWDDPVRLEEVVELVGDLVFSKRLAGKAEEGGWFGITSKNEVGSSLPAENSMKGNFLSFWL
jgi:hypothetical protein